MKLVLKNIGMLREAELNLNNLSVIAGENDNGKSTIGKVMFCLIKAINRYKEDLQESKEYRFEEILRNFFFYMRRSLREDNKSVSNALINLNTMFDFSFDESFDERLERLENIANQLKSMGVDAEISDSIQKTQNELQRIKQEPEDITKSMENALAKVFASEFDSRILLDGEDEGIIRLVEQNNILINIKVSKGNRIHIVGETVPIEFKDATFIESPLILNNHDLLVRSQSALNIHKRNINRLGVPYTTLHTKDLFDKLREPPFGELLDNKIYNIIKSELNDTVDGEVIYDEQNKDFSFQKNKIKLPIKNTASGIKIFGILQLLSSNGFINKNNFLIFDEPENHLHPNWQLKLAKILVTLAENGVYVLVSSHSPYMIEAIKRFSDRSTLKDEAAFYLSEGNVIRDKNRLEDIFRILSEPFEIFRQMDVDIVGDE